MPFLPAKLALSVPLVVLLVVACGGSPATQPAASPAPTPEVPSFDKELEAKLPDTFDGEALVKYSLSGTDAVRGDPTTLAVITAAGKTEDDFSIAGAVGQTSGVSFMAIRLKGADEVVIQQLFERSAEQSGDKVEKVSLGGRDVYRISGPSGTGAVFFLVKGDTAVGLTAADDASAEKALAALP